MVPAAVEPAGASTAGHTPTPSTPTGSGSVSVPAPRGHDRRPATTRCWSATGPGARSSCPGSRPPSTRGHRQGGGTGRQTPQQVEAALADVQYSPYEPVPVMQTAPTVDGPVPDSHQSEFPGVSVATGDRARATPRAGRPGTHVLGYVGAITGTELKAHPNQGYTQSSQIGKTGLEEQYEQYLRGAGGQEDTGGRRPGERRGHPATDAPTPGRHPGHQHRQPTSRRPCSSALHIRPWPPTSTRHDSGTHPAATDGAAIVHERQERRRCWPWPRPHLQPQRRGWAASRRRLPGALGQLPSADLRRLPAQQQRHPGPVHPRVDLQADHRHRRAQRRAHQRRHDVDDTGTRSTCPTAPTGCAFHDDQASDAGPVNVHRGPHQVGRLLLLHNWATCSGTTGPPGHQGQRRSRQRRRLRARRADRHRPAR